MAIKTREEILESIRGRFGDDTSDETISLVEDITDTITDMERKANGNGTDWKKKYEENDANWRKKYRDRFFGSPAEGDDDDIDEPSAPSKKNYTFENLFKEG